jgi:hypothetical protein
VRHAWSNVAAATIMPTLVLLLLSPAPKTAPSSLVSPGAPASKFTSGQRCALATRASLASMLSAWTAHTSLVLSSLRLNRFAGLLLLASFCIPPSLEVATLLWPLQDTGYLQTAVGAMPPRHYNETCSTATISSRFQGPIINSIQFVQCEVVHKRGHTCTAIPSPRRTVCMHCHRHPVSLADQVHRDPVLVRVQQRLYCSPCTNVAVCIRSTPHERYLSS